MAAVDLQEILRCPGRLCVDPTDLSTAWPHGGTGLGSAGSIFFDPEARSAEIPDEGTARAQEAFFLGFQPRLRFALRQPYNADVVNKWWPNTAVGAVSGKRVIAQPGAFKAGQALSARSMKLLFTPYDQLGHYGVVFYKALPLIARKQSMVFGPEDEVVLLAESIPIDDASGRQFAFGLLVDLSL